MKKLILFGIGFLLIMGFVTASKLLITPATFTSVLREDSIRYEGNVTYTCNGLRMQLELNEPNMNIDDDFRDANLNCTGVVENVIDWTGRQYKEVEINGEVHRSFNEQKLTKALEDYEESLLEGVG